MYKHCFKYINNKHSQGGFCNIATDFAFVSLLPYAKTENTENIQVLSLAEV